MGGVTVIVCRALSLGRPGSSIVDSLDLTVSAGEVCTIVGPSGSGKTRLCRLLGGTERPVDGVITVDGRNVAECPGAIPHRVTHVVPEAPLWPGRSTTANVEYVMRLCGLPRPSNENVILALRLAEVPDRLFGAPTEALTHFQRYLVWLAIHRLRRVPVLLLDDPFLKLAGWETGSLARLIQEAVESEGCAVITSGSADVPTVIAGHRYRITRGRLMPIDTPTSWLDDDADMVRMLSPDRAS